MDFHVPCVCGATLTVSEGAAGSSRDCSCGRTIAVPSLTDLRLLAGLPPQAPNPVVAIPYLIADGLLPTMTTCAGCNAATEETATVTAECEIASRSSESSWIGVVLLFWIFGVWALLLRLRHGDRPDQGDSKIVHCPLRMCRACQRQTSRNATVWIWLAVAQAVLAVILLAWSDWGAILLLTAALTVVWEFAARNRQQTALKKLLRQEPIYDQLLEDFPKANVLLNVD